MRINELARELEVKARAILEFLEEIGEGKKSHSSTIDDQLIAKVKKHFQDGGRAEPQPAASPEPPAAPLPESKPVPAAAAASPKPEPRPEFVPRPIAATPPQANVALPGQAPSAVRRPATTQGETPAQTGSAAPVAASTPAPAPSTAIPGRRTPLRPPIRHHPEPPPATAGTPISATSAPPAAAPTVVVTPPATQATSAQQPAAAGAPASARPASVPPRPVAPSHQPIYRPPTKGPLPAGSRPPVPGGRPPATPARPGEPIYVRRPARPGGGPPRMGPPGASPAFPPPETGRRGPHPVRGRPHGPSRPDREREARERALRSSTQRTAPAVIHVDREITITEGITVKDLSEKLGVKARDLIRRLLDQGVISTINQTLDPAVAEQVAQSFGATTRIVSFEEEAAEQVEIEQKTEGKEGRLVPRAPVVTVMGHVDHGKTSLLDAIRETSVTEQEHGGITQHIGAYTVSVNNRKIVFLDTPGHEAFTRMRARGAKVTDVVVLVVSADDGVMPQTIEAISHARSAKVPIIVAINKIDKPGAMPERVKKQLGEHGLVPEEWGGDTVMVEVSAKQKTNLQVLLEMILLVTDMLELKANPDLPASGTVLEAKLDKGRGPVCSLLVLNGTLRVGDSFLVGAVFGKVRAMLDDRGHAIEEAGPATPVEILGLQSLPQAGDQFQAVTDAIKAKQIAIYRESKLREMNLAKSSRVTLEQFQDQMRAGNLKELPIILKADVQGSLEVLTDSFAKIGDERVKVKIVYAGVGAINVSDVLLASASNSVIVGFNVRPERKATELAQQEQVDIRLHTVIYDVIDEIRKALTGLLEPTQREVILGKAEVRQTFRVAKVGTVAGTVVSEGKITKDSQVRLLRDNVVVHQGRISSLRRFKDDVQEVRSGLECGIALENYSDVKVGDVIEAFVTERVAAAALA